MALISRREMQTRSQRAVSPLIIIVAVVLVAARLAAHQFAPETSTNDLVNWVSLEEAGTLASTDRKPILVYFTAEWCGPCHILDAEVFADAALAKEINARFIPVRVMDRQREEGRNSVAVARLEQRYAVRAFPTVVFAGPDGTELGRMEGYGGREEFRRVMESVR